MQVDERGETLTSTYLSPHCTDKESSAVNYTPSPAVALKVWCPTSVQVIDDSCRFLCRHLLHSRLKLVTEHVRRHQRMDRSHFCCSQSSVYPTPRPTLSTFLSTQDVYVPC
jgi:hypothetical protein